MTTKTTETEALMIHKWTMGKFVFATDPRAPGWDASGDAYEKALVDAGFRKAGDPVGSVDSEQFAYELYEHTGGAKWIVDLIMAHGCHQILAEGLPDLLSLLNHLAPIVLSSTVSSNAMAFLEDGYHKLVEKERENYRRTMGIPE
jgi:hypothetical protein